MPKLWLILCTSSGFTKVLGTSVANTGSIVVTVPKGIVPGADYTIKVQSASAPAITSKSVPFTVGDEHRERCVFYGTRLLGLPAP